MGDFVVGAHGKLASYPPQKAGSRYRRTGTLGRSWSHKVIPQPDKIVGIVGSQGQIAPYNVLVQGAQQTALMKARGWKTPKDVIEKEWPKFRANIRKAVKGAV